LTLRSNQNALSSISGAAQVSVLNQATVGTLSGGTVTNSGLLTVNGGTFTGVLSGAGGLFTSGILAVNASSLSAFTGSVSAGGGSLSFGTVLSGTNALSISSGASVTLPSGNTLGAVTNAGTLSLGSTTLGGSLAVNGGSVTSTGTLTLGAAFGITSNGGGTISGGSLSLATAGNSVDVSAGSLLTITSTVTGGTLTKTGAGKLSLSEATVAQDLVINGGTVALTSGLVVFYGSLKVNSGTLALTGTGSLTSGKALSSTGTGVVSGGSLALTSSGLTVDVAGNSLSVSSVLTGSGSLTKTSAGILALTGASTFTGGVNLNSGTLSVGNASALGTGSLYAANGTSLDSTTSSTLTNAQVYAGSIGFVGTNSLTTSGAVTLSNNATVNVVANTLTLGGNVNGGSVSLTKSGSGTLVFNGTTNYTGGTTISGGSLVLGVSNALYTGGTLTISGGTLSIGSGISQTLDTFTLTSGSLLGSGSLSYYNFSFGTNSYVSPTVTTKLLFVTSGSSTTVAKTLTGGNVGSIDGGTVAAFNVTGSTTANNLNGNSVTVSSGTLTVNGTLTTSASLSIGAGSLTLGSSASLSTPLLSMGSSSTVTLGGTSALNNVTKLEVGTSGSSGAKLVLAEGTTTLGGGSLAQTVKGSGSISILPGSSLALGNSLTLAPGNSPGTLGVVGTVTVVAGAAPTLEFEYTATGAVAAGAAANDYLFFTGGSLTTGTSTLNVSAIAYNSLTSSGASISSGSVGQSRVNDTAAHRFAIINGVNGAASNFNVTSYLGVNSLGGNYATAPARTATITATPSITAGSLYLTIQRTPFATIGSTQNVAALGSLLDNSLTVTTGGISSLIDILDATALTSAGLSLGTSSGTLDRAVSYASINAQLQGINPAGYAELANIGFDRLLDVQLGLVNHLRTLALPALQSEKDGDMYAWTSAYGGWTKRDSESSNGSAGYSSNNAGNLTGVEKRFGKLTLGLTGAVGSTSSTLGLGMGSVTTDTWHVGLYGSSPVEASGRSVVLDAAFVYGNGDTTFKRDNVSVTGVSGGGSTSAKATNSEWMLQFGAALPFRTSDESLTVTPSVHLVLAGLNQNALSEGSLNGLGALVSKNNATSTAVRSGVQVAKLLKLANKETRLTASLDWVHSFDSDRRDVDIALTGSTGGSTKFQSSKAGADAARLGLGAEMALTPRTRLRVNLDEQVQSSQSSTNGSVSIGVQF